MTYKHTRRSYTQIQQVGQALPDNAPAKGHTSAFTLIELLVVVLIIGILAAVVVPQYQKAVKKARFTEVKTQMGSLMNAVDKYLLEHGNIPADFSNDSLDISMPTGQHTNCSVWGEEEEYAWVNCDMSATLGGAYLYVYRTAGNTWQVGGFSDEGDAAVNQLMCEYIESAFTNYQNNGYYKSNCQ